MNERDLGELVGQVQEINRRLDRLEVMLSGRLDNYSARLRKIESWKAWATGIVAALIALPVIGYLVNLFNGRK